MISLFGCVYANGEDERKRRREGERQKREIHPDTHTHTERERERAPSCMYFLPLTGSWIFILPVSVCSIFFNFRMFEAAAEFWFTDRTH